MRRAVDAGHDRGADHARHRQVRHDPADDDPARDEEQQWPDQDDGTQRARARRPRPWPAAPGPARRSASDSGGPRASGPGYSRQGVPQRVDDSEHDRAHDPPRRPRCLLRRGRAARSAGVARAPGRRRRRRWRGGSRRRIGCQLRGPQVRDPFGDVAARGVPALSRCGLPAGRRPALPAGQPRRDDDPAPLHARWSNRSRSTRRSST